MAGVTPMSNPFNLQRFVDAQEGVYEGAVAERRSTPCSGAGTLYLQVSQQEK
jgi:uncharacterized protein (DUF1810 family)